MHNNHFDSLPPTNIYQKEDSDEIVTVIKNRNEEAQTVAIVNKSNRKTVQMSAISPGVFATIQDDDYDFADINSKYHYKDSGIPIDLQLTQKTQTQSIIQQTPCDSYKELEVAVVYESSFCSEQGSSSNADDKVTSLIAGVSMKFQQDGICVKVVISHLEGNCDIINDPYREYMSLNLSGCDNTGVLQRVQGYWMNYRTDIPRDTVLFLSGTALECTDAGCVVGCAFQGSLCTQTYGYAVHHITYIDDFNLQATLIAHELGHNCGADHEGESGFIMNAGINAASNGFSSDSIQSMADTFASTQCLEEIGAPTISPAPSAPSFPTNSPPNSTSLFDRLNICALQSRIRSSLKISRTSSLYLILAQYFSSLASPILNVILSSNPSLMEINSQSSSPSPSLSLSPTISTVNSTRALLHPSFSV